MISNIIVSIFLILAGIVLVGTTVFLWIYTIKKMKEDWKDTLWLVIIMIFFTLFLLVVGFKSIGL